MKSFFARNIEAKGRVVRAFGALALFVGAALGFPVSVWLGVALLGSGVFVGFEALRGWCFLRACGIKTKL